MKKQDRGGLIINLFVFSGGLLFFVVRSFLSIIYESDIDGNIIRTVQPNNLPSVIISFILWIILDICTRDEKMLISVTNRNIVTIGYCYALFMMTYISDYLRSWFLFTVLVYIILVLVIGLLKFFMKSVKDMKDNGGI